MMHDDDDKIAVIARPQLLAELARRVPDSPEGRALATCRLVLGVAACGHLDDGPEGLMLVVELDDLYVARVGYTLDHEGRQAVRYQLHGVTGDVHEEQLWLPMGLEAALRALVAWAKIKRRD